MNDVMDGPEGAPEADLTQDLEVPAETLDHVTGGRALTHAAAPTAVEM